jgi:hypothetical protein
MGRVATMLGTLVLGLGLSDSAYADFCINADNGVNYRLQFGTGNPIAGTPLILNGTRTVSTIKTPVIGTLITTATETIIGLEEMYPFGSGVFSHPNGTTILRFPKTGPDIPRFDTTFHGNGAPHNVLGLISIVACPASETANESGQPDPNGRN